MWGGCWVHIALDAHDLLFSLYVVLERYVSSEGGGDKTQGLGALYPDIFLLFASKLDDIMRRLR